jgi:hypothetical protein
MAVPSRLAAVAPRRAGRIRKLLLIGTLALVLGAAPARALADGFVTADYAGTWDEAFVDQPGNPAFWQQSMHFVWDEQLTAHVGGNPTIVTILSRTLTIKGMFRSTYAPPRQAMSCSAMFAVRKGGLFPLLLTASGSVANPVLDFAAIAPRQGRYAQLNGAGDCTFPANGGAGAGGSTATSHFERALAPMFSFRLNRPSRKFTPKTIKTFDFNPDGTKQIAVSAVFRAAMNGNRPPPLPPLPPLDTPVRDVSKRNALNGLRVTVVQSIYPCGVGLAGITLLGAGPAGAAAGAVMGGLGVPLCRAFVKTITDEDATYLDPPRSDYLTVATVAAPRRLAPRASGCTSFSGSTTGFCLRVSTAGANLLAAVRHTQALTAAIKVTVGRDTAAAAARSQAAVNLQEQALRNLSSGLASARRAQSTAGAALESALATGPVSVRITVPQFTRDATRLLSAISRAGVSAAKLRKLTSAALRPRRFDPIAVF